MNVGFIGLGLMGGAMAANLLKGGHAVRGYDIFGQAVDKLVSRGGTAAASPAEAARGADIVFTMLPNGPEVEQAVTGPQGIAEALRPGALYVDSSTILPSVTLKVGGCLRAKGIGMLDAAVGRTSEEAVTGKLLFMIGGDKKDILYAKPCLDCMGDTIMHCGPLGAGISSKLVNNYMTTTLNVLTAEALTLAAHLGLDRNKIIEVLRGTAAGRGHINTTYPGKALAGDLSPAFMIDLADKDLGLVLDLGASTNVPLLTGAGARQGYSMARAQGRGRQDWTAMLPAFEQLAAPASPRE